MMILNLLPPTKKEEVRYKKIFISVKRLISGVALLLVVVIIILYGTQIILKDNLNKIENRVDQAQEVTERLSIPIIQVTKDFNQTLKDIEDIQKYYVKWTGVLKQFNQLVPDNIQLTFLSFKLENRQVEIKGRAPNRSVFLDFKNNLENSNILTDLHSPISNLLTRENVEFEFTAKLSEEIGSTLNQ